MTRSWDSLATGSMRTLAALLAFLWLSLAAVPAQSTNIAPRLIAESATPRPSDSTAIALTMTPEKGWHGYWINGGDAGFGLNVEWNAPEGVTVSPFRYPVPDALILFGMMNHVYEHPYALIAEVKVAPNIAPGTDLTLTGVASWLACTDKVCVPEKSVISVAMKAGDGKVASKERDQFDQWRAMLPQPIDRPGTWERRGSMVRFAIPLPATVTTDKPYLFVQNEDVVDYPAAQIFSRNGNHLIVETRAKGDASGNISALLKLGDGRGLTVALTPGAVPAAGEKLTPEKAGQSFDIALFAAALGGAILGGLILNLMPCVFPILSLKALSLARSGGSDARAAKPEALAYTAGAIVTTLALGGVLLALRAAGEQVGWAFQLQHPLSVLVLFLLALAITLNLLGEFELPSFGRGSALANQGGAAGGFWTGVLAAFVATPCSGPLLGAALGATLVLPAWAALPIFGGLGLGIALPFLAIGYMPALRNRLPKPGPWMARFRKWMALPMGLTTLGLAWLLLRQTATVNWWSLALLVFVIAAMLRLYALWMRDPDRGHLGKLLFLIPALSIVVLATHVSTNGGGEGAGAGSANTYSPDALTKARASGKPVFLYFTADWCLSCKANEAGAINRDTVQTAFEKAEVVTLVGDWTNGDPVITRKLAEHGRNSVPLYLWYTPGTNAPELLPQILTPTMLTERARKR